MKAAHIHSYGIKRARKTKIEQQTNKARKKNNDFK